MLNTSFMAALDWKGFLGDGKQISPTLGREAMAMGFEMFSRSGHYGTAIFKISVL
jgi:hypothetical protein